MNEEFDVIIDLTNEEDIQQFENAQIEALAENDSNEAAHEVELDELEEVIEAID